MQIGAEGKRDAAWLGGANGPFPLPSRKQAEWGREGAEWGADASC